MVTYFIREKWATDPELDGYDRYLLMLIEYDSRHEFGKREKMMTATQEELGVRLGLSLDTVRRRLKKLVEKGAIRYTRAGRAGLAIQLIDADYTRLED